MMTSLLPLCKRHLNGAFVVFIKRSPPLAGFLCPKNLPMHMARCGGPFSYPRHAWRTSHQKTPDNTTQKVSAGAFDGVFFTGRWWPFFIYRRKKYV
ncbi:hypothetical protein WKN55_004896 [Escherichia coli]